ncbi:hypothetical protein DAI22_12g064250 [Oryza sativa Japonica Group]|nr:hypothetical protein DAI22_12g064250 [Oryza sativa Japonica Group]
MVYICCRLLVHGKLLEHRGQGKFVGCSVNSVCLIGVNSSHYAARVWGVFCGWFCGLGVWCMDCCLGRAPGIEWPHNLVQKTVVVRQKWV